MEQLGKTKKKRSVYFNKQNLRNFLLLKHTPNPHSTLSNQENKVTTDKPKISYAKALMMNSIPLQDNKYSFNIQPNSEILKEKLKAQHPARQTFK